MNLDRRKLNKPQQIRVYVRLDNGQIERSPFRLVAADISEFISTSQNIVVECVLHLISFLIVPTVPQNYHTRARFAPFN